MSFDNRNEKYLPVLSYWVQEAIPNVYDDSLSLYELINKVVMYLNKVIEAQNGLTDEMNEFLEWANTNLETWAKEQLLIWLEDGTLENIVNESLMKSKMSVHQPLYSDVKVKLNIFRSGVNNINTQGFTITDSGNFITATIDSDNEWATLTEYLNDGTLLRSSSVQTNHSNSLSFYNGKLYIGNLYKMVNGVRQDINTISVIDYSSLTLINKVDVDVIVRGISVNENGIYVLSNSNSTIYVYNHNFIKVKEIQLKGEYLYDLQDIHVTNEHIFINGSSSIIVYNLDGYKVNVYNFENFELYPTQELQGLAYYNGDVYVSNLIYPNGLNDKSIYLIGSINTYNNVQSKNKINQLVNPTAQRQVFVKQEYTGNDSDGSDNKPFKSLEQALMLLHNPNETGLLIHVYSGNYGNVQISHINKSLYILGRANDVVLGGILVNDSSDVILERLKLTGAYSDTRDSALTCRYSPSVSISNMVFDFNKAIMLEHSHLYMGAMNDEPSLDKEINVGINSYLQTQYEHKNITRSSSGFVTSPILEVNTPIVNGGSSTSKNALSIYKTLKLIINHRNEDRVYYIEATNGIHRLNLLQMSFSAQTFLQCDLLITISGSRVSITGETWCNLKDGTLVDPKDAPPLTLKCVYGE